MPRCRSEPAPTSRIPPRPRRRRDGDADPGKARQGSFFSSTDWSLAPRPMRAAIRRLATLAFSSFRPCPLPSVLSSAQETGSSSALSVQMTSEMHSKLGKFASKHGDALFGFIESAHIESAREGDEGGPPATFGSFLDAGECRVPLTFATSTVLHVRASSTGTGSHSLKWIASLIRREELLSTQEEEGRMITLQSYTAITADDQMRRRVLDEAIDLGIDDRGEVIIGNWWDSWLVLLCDLLLELTFSKSTLAGWTKTY